LVFNLIQNKMQGRKAEGNFDFASKNPVLFKVQF